MADQVVIDACVAAKWFLRDEDEADTDVADGILQRILDGMINAHAPTVFPYEVAGLIVKAHRRSRITREDALESVADLMEIPIEVANVAAPVCHHAANLAIEHRKTFQDMTYVQLAIELDCPLLTADAKLSTGVSSAFPFDRVRLLSDL